MFFVGTTAPGTPDGLNEDWVSVTSDLVVVLDGATVRTDTGCQHGVSWYVRKLGAAIINAAANRASPLRQVLGDAIADVAKLHPECDLTHPGTPSAAVGIVRIDGGELHHAVLGDVSVVIETTDRIQVHSDDRVSHTALTEREEADRYPIGDQRKTAALVQMKHAELAARNQPGGYWIAAAEPDASAHALLGSTNLAEVQRLAVLTDGAGRAVSMFHQHTWEGLLDILELAGPTELIQQVRKAEDMDPVGATYPRNKVSDDASVVFATPDRVGGQQRPVNARKGGIDPVAQRAAIDAGLKFLDQPGLLGANPTRTGHNYA